METFRLVVRNIHIVLGFGGLVLFWFPVLTKKGGRLHKLSGKGFAICGYVVTISAVTNSLIGMAMALQRGISPFNAPADFGFLVFLCYLGIVAFAGLHHGLRVIKTKRDPDSLDTPFHRSLIVLQIFGSVTVILYALVFPSALTIVFLALSPVGLLGATSMRRYLKHRERRMEWWFEHMASMIGTGIAFYTAFAVFGASRVFDYSLPGMWSIIPWILPAAIGVPGIQIWTRYYERKFGNGRLAEV